MQVTSLSEIARRANVSTATVSRALNGLAGVSEAKRKEIEAIVTELGYEPRQRAKSAKKELSTQGIICLLQTDDGYLSATELFARQLRAVTQNAASHGYDLVVAFGNDLDSLPPCIANKQVAGVLIYGGMASAEVMTTIEGTPSIWVASHSKIPHSMVMSGNEEAGQIAAQYLLQAGHETLACLYPFEHQVMNSRLTAFASYCEARGKKVFRLDGETQLPRGPRESVGKWHERLLTPLIERWSMLSPRPTGLFSPDDLITAYLYPLLQRRGIRIGTDLTIVSFGNEQSYLAGLDPRPASVDIGPETIGQQAVELLCAAIRNPNGERTIKVSIQPMVVTE